MRWDCFSAMQGVGAVGKENMRLAACLCSGAWRNILRRSRQPETHQPVAVGLQSNQQSIVFSSPNTNTLFSGITVRVNFLLTGALSRELG